MNALPHHLITLTPAPLAPSLPALGVRPNAPKVERCAGPTRPRLITIVDLMTILLTFFVLMFSMTKIDMARFIPLARSYGEAFGGGLPDPAVPRLPEVAAVPGDNLSYLEAVLRPAFAKQPSLADVQFRATAQYIILSWPSNLEGPSNQGGKDQGNALFDAGSSGISEATRRRVFDLGGVLSNLHNRIAIVGQAAVAPATLSAEINPAQAGAIEADAWRLAIGRANALAESLAASGYDKEITVLGRNAPITSADQIQILIMPERPASSSERPASSSERPAS